jgi:hypothetical protein
VNKNGSDLYIIQMAVTGDIKVGRSKDPSQRLKQLQTGCPHPLKIILHVPGKGHLERQIHKKMRYRSTRTQSEWFEEGALAELPIPLYELIDLDDQDWWVEGRTTPTPEPMPEQVPEPEWFKVLRDMKG